MGYDHHITRAEHWVDSASRPITRAEWDAYAAVHPDLRGENRPTDGDPWYELVDRFGNRMTLSWHNDHVYVYGFRGEDLSGLLAIAADLDARFVGDEGEDYDLYGPVGGIG